MQIMGKRVLHEERIICVKEEGLWEIAEREAKSLGMGKTQETRERDRKREWEVRRQMKASRVTLRVDSLHKEMGHMSSQKAADLIHRLMSLGRYYHPQLYRWGNDEVQRINNTLWSPTVCVRVCVCVWERERQRRKQNAATKIQDSDIWIQIPTSLDITMLHLLVKERLSPEVLPKMHSTKSIEASFDSIPDETSTWLLLTSQSLLFCWSVELNLSFPGLKNKWTKLPHFSLP